MYRLVDWNRITKTGLDVAEEFIKLAKLNDIDAKIIRDRRDFIPQHVTARKIDRSKEFITKRIKTFLMPKYEEICVIYKGRLPDINEKVKCTYQNVCAIVSIETKNNIYSIKIQNMDFVSFKHIRLYIMEKIEEKYGIALDEIGDYETYISGGYHLENK